MFETEEDKEKLLVALLALSKRVERELMKRLNPTYIKAMMQLRKLVLELEREGLIRGLQWDRLRSRVIDILRPIFAQLRVELPDLLLTLDPAVVRTIARILEIDPPPFDERTREEIMRDTRFVQKRLIDIIGDGILVPGTLYTQMFNDLDKTIRTEFLKDSPTNVIADKIIVTQRRFGRNIPKIKTGSYANRENNLILATVIGAAWAVVNKNAEKMFDLVPARQWEWVAILDPKTCPICRPLDGMRRDSPSDFPHDIPVHPRCRCLIVPIT